MLNLLLLMEATNAVTNSHERCRNCCVEQQLALERLVQDERRTQGDSERATKIIEGAGAVSPTKPLLAQLIAPRGPGDIQSDSDSDTQTICSKHLQMMHLVCVHTGTSSRECEWTRKVHLSMCPQLGEVARDDPAVEEAVAATKQAVKLSCDFLEGENNEDRKKMKEDESKAHTGVRDATMPAPEPTLTSKSSDWSIDGECTHS